MGEQRGGFATTWFDLVGAGHDHPALSYFPASARRLLDALRLQAGQRLLDVGTGTGALALEAAARLDRSGSVVGIDLSEAVLIQARSKAGVMQLSNVEFGLMDAAHLQFGDCSFDVVSCAFTLFFLEDMVGGAREWQRVLKLGGLLGLSVWGRLAFEPMASLMISRQRQYGLEVPDPQPIKRTADPERCRELLWETGFSDIDVRCEQYGRYLESASEWWDVGSNMGFGSVLAKLSPHRLKQFKAEHLAEIEPLFTDQGLWLNLPVTFAVARK